MKSLGLTAEFFYPHEDNDYRTLHQQRYNFTRELFDLAGAYTDKGIAYGVWKDKGSVNQTVFQDTFQIFECAGLSLAQIEGLALMIKTDARQVAVYLKIDGKAFLV